MRYLRSQRSPARATKQQFVIAAIAVLGRSSDRIRRDLAVERARGQIGVRFLVLDRFRRLRCWKLDNLNLVRIDSIVLQHDLQQVHIGLRAADHADLVAG